MIENFNDMITFIVIVALPIMVLVTLYRYSDFYKHRKHKFSKTYYDEVFDGSDDEIDY